MALRSEYVRTLASVPPPIRPAIGAGMVRHPTAADQERLATLMIDAYRGTIDDDGETLDDARAEIRSYFQHAEHPPLLHCSWVCVADRQIVAVCLAAYWAPRGCPLIAYVMTAPPWKARSLARYLLQLSLDRLRGAGFAEVRAVITSGNTPSERLFAGLGFTPVAPPPTA